MSLAVKMITWVGGLALLMATFVDTIAVVGRNIGLPLTGSIEVMQALIVLSAGLGLVIATLEGAHARVRLVVDRLEPDARSLADRVSNLLTMLFLLAMLAGSVWIAIDLWDAHEQSEWLEIPWAAMRMVANACLLICTLILGLRVIRGERG
jgi:TRAP-type C4-dicarboxylate transport system permease small subunit